jgi:outer membrane protein OmpA-like peptidoglycan-associated protein
MRSTSIDRLRGTPGLALLCLGLAGCPKEQKPDPFPEVGKIQTADPAFVRSDPASSKSCKADTDCGLGNLCHPGQFVCFSVYPQNRMINVSMAEPVDASQCRPVNVYFPFDSAELVGEAKAWLDYDARCFRSRGLKRLIVEAHCDARGDDAYNLKLSQRRGEAVKQHLESEGVKVPIEIRPLGRSEPIKAGLTEQDYAWNRRVEFRME